MKNINKLLKLASLFFSEAVKLEPITSITSNEDISDMEKIEQESFSKYQFGYADDAEEIEDDLSQPGVAGFALKDDDNKIVGYLYGYNFIMEDNWEDIDPESEENEWFIEDKESEISEFVQAAEANKVFYITNLAILPKYGSNFLALILSLKKELRNNNYKYIVLGALSDSLKLIEKGGPALLRRLGVKPIVRRSEYDQMIYVMKVVY